MTIVANRPHTDAVIDALEALGLTVGDAKAPAGVPPYCVVYPIPGGWLRGTLSDPQGDAELVYQATCVGEKREQAQWVEDKVKGLTTITVAGRYIAHVYFEGGSGGVTRDDDADPPLFYATPRFRVVSFTS